MIELIQQRVITFPLERGVVQHERFKLYVFTAKLALPITDGATANNGRSDEQERRILSAMSEIGTTDDSLVSSKALRNSLYCVDLSAPTYHRALKALLDKQYLKPAEGRKTGLYRLCL